MREGPVVLVYMYIPVCLYVSGLVQDSGNNIANALELHVLQSCSKP